MECCRELHFRKPRAWADGIPGIRPKDTFVNTTNHHPARQQTLKGTGVDKQQAFQDVRHYLREWEQALARVDDVHAKVAAAGTSEGSDETQQAGPSSGPDGATEIRRAEYRALCKWEELKDAVERWHEMTGQLRPKLELKEILDILRAEMPNLEKTYHVKSLGVFGPYATGKNYPDSVLNMVVEYHKLPGLIGLGKLENYLSDLLGVKVDLGPKDSLRPHIKERVLQELVPV